MMDLLTLYGNGINIFLFFAIFATILGFIYLYKTDLVENIIPGINSVRFIVITTMFLSWILYFTKPLICYIWFEGIIGKLFLISLTFLIYYLAYNLKK